MPPRSEVARYTISRRSNGNNRLLVAVIACCYDTMARLKQDLRMLRFWRSLISEFVGSLFLVLIGCGAYTVTYPEHPITVKVALSFGFVYAALLYSVRNVGDAHLNPSITVAMLVTRRISPVAGLLYVAAQFLGSLIGAALVLAFTAPAYRRRGAGDGTIVNKSQLAAEQWWLGGCTVPSEHTSEAQAFAVELLGTLLFVFVVFAAYDKTKTDRVTPASPFVVGITNAAILLFAIPYSGGSLNTARSFATAIVNGVWSAHWVYWFGPLIGGIVGGAFYDLIYSSKSSFSRIRTCMLVFNQPDDEDASTSNVRKNAEGVEQIGELEMVEVEYSGKPKSGTGSGTDSKPRIKFYRPTFTCCAGSTNDREEAKADDSGDIETHDELGVSVELDPKTTVQ